MTEAVKIPHVNVTGAEHWLQHDAGPWLARISDWIVNAVTDTVTALAAHQIPDPLQSLAAILLIFAVTGMVVHRAKARKAKKAS